MKSEVMPSVIQMEQDELQTLMTEVKETIATEFVMPAQSRKAFTHLNMWNIHRQRKSVSNFYR